MATPVCRAFTRQKLIHGVEWRIHYLVIMLCVLVLYTSLWYPTRLLMLPVAYWLPRIVFRWAGHHDYEWSQVYPKARRNRHIFLAQASAKQSDPSPAPRVLPKLPRFRA